MEKVMAAPPLQLRHRAIEAAVVFLVVGAFYLALLSQIVVDDVPRYVDELQSNRFHWDLGHLWMQPVALLLFRGPLNGLGVMRALEVTNIASVALGAAIFFSTVRRLRHGQAEALLATALVVFSYNLIALGPTAHIKLIVFPALALSLHYAACWEQAVAAGSTRTNFALLSGLWLGAGANLLVSVLPAALFVAIFMIVRTRQPGASTKHTLASPLSFLAGVAVAGFALLLAAYLAAQATDTTSASSLLGFLFGGIREKQDLHVGLAGWREVPFRFAFSLIFNFVFLPSLGSLGRAWLWGMLPGIGPNALSLLAQALIAGLSLAALISLIVVAAIQWRARSTPSLLAFGYVLGAAVFSAYYNLNDPEHWFQFTLPFALIAAQADRRWLKLLIFGVWLPLLAAVNLGLYGIPKASFDLAATQKAYEQALGSNGLAIGFAAYPGEPDSSLLAAATSSRFNLDLTLLGPAKGDVNMALQLLDEKIADAFSRNGRVLVFRVLDTGDWRGPVMQMALAGMTRDHVRSTLAARYQLSQPLTVAGFSAVEINRKAP